MSAAGPRVWYAPADARLKVFRAAEHGESTWLWPGMRPTHGTGPRVIPADGTPFEHVVSAGETLSGIAAAYHGPRAPWGGIATANGLQPPYTLQLGQRLVLPDVVVVESSASVELALPEEDSAEAATRQALLRDVNVPPADAFEEQQAGLHLVRPLREAYYWDVPLKLAAVFAAALLVSALSALAGLRTASEVKALGRRLAWAVGAASGAFAVAASGGVVIAGTLASLPEAQCVFVLAVGAASAASAYLVSRDEAGGRTSVARAAWRFAYSLCVSLSVLGLAGVASGWLTNVLVGLQLPG
jgi:hypothetical protein